MIRGIIQSDVCYVQPRSYSPLDTLPSECYTAAVEGNMYCVNNSVTSPYGVAIPYPVPCVALDKQRSKGRGNDWQRTMEYESITCQDKFRITFGNCRII